MALFPSHFTLAGAVLAADTTRMAFNPSPPLGQFFKVAALLAAVLLLVWLTLHFLRRFTGTRGGALGGCKLLGGMPLGPRRSLQFVKIGGKVYVIGVTDHHISHIATIDDNETVTSLTLPTRSAPQSFGDFLKGINLRGKAAADE